MLTRHAITRRADTDGVDGAVVERDYVLTHIVAQLHRATMEGTARLVFKGGTALRLVHLGDYRYSADLDFTILGGNPSECDYLFWPHRDHLIWPHLASSIGEVRR